MWSPPMEGLTIRRNHFHQLHEFEDRLASDTVLSSDGIHAATCGSAPTARDALRWPIWSSLDSHDGLIGNRVNHVLEDKTDILVQHGSRRDALPSSPRRRATSTGLDDFSKVATNSPGTGLPRIEQGRSSDSNWT